MSEPSFQTFIVGGLLVLIGAIGFLAWTAWRYVDRERDMETLALEGVGHELRINLQRFVSELGMVARSEATGPSDLLPVNHPQLDAVLARPVEADRRALSVIRAAYDELGARKLDIRSTLAQGQDLTGPMNSAASALIETIGTLYLWEQHGGRSPETARPTRSWHVRDWMKTHRFTADALPGLHLRDEVVENLRRYGMALKPKPLNHTASQYYAKRYDRKSDPRAPMWKRKAPVIPDAQAMQPETDTVQNTLS